MKDEGDEAAAYLRRYSRVADARLAELLQTEERRLAGLPFDPAGYLRLLREYVLRGGKRLRGALVMLGHEACGGAPTPAALDVSLSFELLHASLLAVDDVMDRDELRRGGPALHVAAAREAARRGSRDPAHRGMSVTLLLAMQAASLARRLVAQAPVGAEARLELAGWFAEVEAGVVLGQEMDVAATDAKEVPAWALNEIHRRKTGIYTMEGPLVLGAMLAGVRADDPRMAALRAFAGPLGEAFQLVDDVLGATGNPGETGKPALADVREGKRTAVVTEALARADAAGRALLEACLGREIGADTAGALQDLLVRTGAAAAVRDRARERAARALEALGAAPLAQPARDVLVSLAAFVTERRS